MDDVVILIEQLADFNFLIEEVPELNSSTSWEFVYECDPRFIKGNKVYGKNIPLSIAYYADVVWEICFIDKPPEGKYTVEDMRNAGAYIKKFYVFDDYQSDNLCKRISRDFNTLHMPLDITDTSFIEPEKRWKQYLFG